MTIYKFIAAWVITMVLAFLIGREANKKEEKASDFLLIAYPILTMYALMAVSVSAVKLVESVATFSISAFVAIAAGTTILSWGRTNEEAAAYFFGGMFYGLMLSLLALVLTTVF